MTAPPTSIRERPPYARAAVFAIAAVVIVTHLAVNAWSPYGIHRDEFLYMAMGDHLRLFRMDFPPFIALAWNAEHALLGDSLIAIRFLPMLAAAATLALAAAIAREMGGGRFAQVLAALAVAVHPLFLRPGNLFQPVVFDQLWWTLTLWALVRLRGSGDPRWWLAIGAALGLGLLTKFSILILGFALFVALLIEQRDALRTRAPWLAALLALAIGSPSVIGQVALGWPLLEQMRVLRESQLAYVSYASFLSRQLILGPAFLLALAGALALFRRADLRPFRIVGITCVTAFLTVMLAKGKPYYIGPIYPTLFAAGSVALGALASTRATRVLRIATVSAIVLFGLFIAPAGLPILPPPAMERWGEASGFSVLRRTNQGHLLRLPQDYADMLGWEDLARAVQHVYDSLPPEKRAQVVIAGENYGEAGALEFYGRRLGLPNVVSTAGSFWFFGPGEKPGAVVITAGVPRRSLERFCGVVTPAAHLVNDWLVEEEQDRTIYVCEQPRLTLQELWPGEAGHN
ncbi:MAG TPA: glycosyltransferase family 39 protein [Gemmatimonadaceae bacterium]|nr:glycosyltransferase family 39 protein [Gemmatimonadaceae bacterium]